MPKQTNIPSSDSALHKNDAEAQSPHRSAQGSVGGELHSHDGAADMASFLQETTGKTYERVEKSFGNGYVRLKSEEAERRQAKHDIRSAEDVLLEMMRNSRDANARNIFIATSKSGDHRHLCMIDDGCGIPKDMWEHIFESRVTTKLNTVHMDPWGIHGRGMALYAIRENVEKAFVQDSRIDGGSAFSVIIDTRKLPEKRDQSTFPRFFKSETGVIEARGPRNILRCVAEFAYREENVCNVYLGSDAQIAATLYAYGRSITSPTQRAFDHGQEIDLCKRIAYATDPESFVAQAQSIGLSLSARTARRIMNGEVCGVEDSATLVTNQLRKISASGNNPNDPAQDRNLYLSQKGSQKKGKGSSEKTNGKNANYDLKKILLKELTTSSKALTSNLRLSPDDKEHFQKALQSAYASFADKYYLSTDVTPEITIKNSEMVIRIPLRRDDML